MLEKINEISNKTRKSKIFIFFDMTLCAIKYQAGYMDYWLFEMYNLNSSQRKTIMTRGKNNYLIKKYNDKKYIHIFENKDEFLEKFKDYVKRDFLFLNDNFDEFKSFCKKHRKFIAKPRDGSCGKGIEIIKINDNVNEIYKYLLEKKLIVLEELIIQDKEIDKINPNCINTFRIVSINKNNEVGIVAAYFRIGGGNNFVDNFNSDGMVVPIEISTGSIKYNALDKNGNLYKFHPNTNYPLVGFVIPKWNEIKELVKKLAQVVPEVGMVGWDIALSNNGPVVVEANDFPGHDIYQLPPHRTNGMGVLPQFTKYF